MAKTKMAAVAKTGEPVMEKLTADELTKRFNPGQHQWARWGGAGEWEVESLVSELMKNGYRPEEGVIKACDDGEILDGNRRATAIVTLAQRNPTWKKIKVDVLVYPTDLSREEREDIRLRAARGTKAWSRADFVHCMVSMILDYPGDAPEAYLADRIGLDRIREQFPRAIKLNKEGKPELDAAGRPIFQNRQGVFQDAKRLARLPHFVRTAFYAGLDGKGPAIPSRLLTTLTADFAKDKEVNGDVQGLCAPGSTSGLEDLLDLVPTSDLGARMVELLNPETAPGRGAGKGAMSAKDIEQTLGSFAGSMPAVHLLHYVKRSPGYGTEEANRKIRDLFVRIAALVVEDTQATGLLNEVARTVAKAKPATAE